eukprot:m.86324 g.86324  ORF g.86324 m.86324 type:complete len:177 (-) comp8427_c0_seq4:161-691(-)
MLLPRKRQRPQRLARSSVSGPQLSKSSRWAASLKLCWFGLADLSTVTRLLQEELAASAEQVNKLSKEVAAAQKSLEQEMQAVRKLKKENSEMSAIKGQLAEELVVRQSENEQLKALHAQDQEEIGQLKLKLAQMQARVQDRSAEEQSEHDYRMELLIKQNRAEKKRLADQKAKLKK